MDIGTILQFWENVGVFDYLLPFLLIFAVVFGILGATRILSGNKGVNVVIAVVIGLLSLRVGYVQTFFREVFPSLGVGIAILLMILILTGLFIRQENLKIMYWIFIGIGALIAGIVLFGSFSNIGWIQGGWYASDWVAWAISIVFLVALVVVVVIGQQPAENKNWAMDKTTHRAVE